MLKKIKLLVFLYFIIRLKSDCIQTNQSTSHKQLLIDLIQDIKRYIFNKTVSVIKLVLKGATKTLISLKYYSPRKIYQAN